MIKLNRKYSVVFFVLIFCHIFSQSESKIVDSLKLVIKESRNPKEVINAKADLFLKYFLSGNKRSALALYKEALQDATVINDLNGLTVLYNNYGNLMYNSNFIDSAKFYFTKAYALTKKTKDEKLQLRLISNLGSIEYMNGNYQEAMKMYEQGLKLESELKMEEGTYMSINNIGFIYHTLDMPQMAHKYFLKAEKIYKKNNKLNSLYYSYDGLSITYHAINKNDSAVYYALKALEVAKQLNDQYSVGYEYDNLGSLYKYMKKYDTSIDYYKKGIEHNKVLKDDRLAMSLYANLTDVYILTNNDLANIYAEKTMSVGSKLKIDVDKKNLFMVFANLSARKKDYENAYKYLYQFNVYKDSMYNSEMSAKISELQTKYETDRREKENSLLQIDNEKKNSEISNQKKVRNYLIIIICLFLAGIIGAFYTYRKIRFINSELNLKNNSIEQKNTMLEIQKKEILDSIHYAKRIQSTLLAHTDFVNGNIPNNFILFKPKDIVSGDFYWATKKDDLFYLAICDSTGHGVPGAFMSLLNIGFLSEAINEKDIFEPHKVFNYVRQRLINGISKEGQQDGFDGILVCFNQTTKKITYAAANNAPIIVRNNQIIELEKDKMPVGKGEKTDSFKLHEIHFQLNDSLYFYTDGFADQFGGPRGKKYLYKRLNDLLLSISNQNLETQQQQLNSQFEEWRGSLEQVDDVLVVGIRV